MKIPKLSNKCGYSNISKKERRLDQITGKGLEGTFEYEKRGCFSCDGYDVDCINYFSPLKEYLKGLRGQRWKN